MSRRTTLAILLATLLVAAAAVPAAVTAQTAKSTLTVDVAQDADGDVTVTVSDNGTAVENATVSVDTVDENASYAGEGAHDTDANGTVDLPVPNESVSVVVTAVEGDETASTTADLEAPSLTIDVEQDADAEATVTVNYAITGEPVDGADVTVSTVDENETYADTGDHETDENGTVALAAPDDPVEVAISAEAGDLSGSTTVVLENASTVAEDDPDNFGQRVSAFVHSLLNGDEHERQLGLMIAQWVTANNPGNAPDHAGPPEDVGPHDDDGDEGDDGERGPPDHAADDDERDDENEEGEEADDEEADEQDDDDDDDDRGGPPEHADSNGHGNDR